MHVQPALPAPPSPQAPAFVEEPGQAGSSAGPLTPPGLTTTPTVPSATASPADHRATAAARTQLSARARTAQQAACSGAAARACARSFAACASRSPLVKSALLGLAVEGALPRPDGADESEHDAPHDGSSALQWALAQLLALHLRAGLTIGE